MTIDIYRSAWGLVGDGGAYKTLLDFVDSAYQEKYVGVEFPMFQMDAEVEGRVITEQKLIQKLQQFEMKYIPLIATWPEDFSSYQQHMAGYKQQCQQAQKLGVEKAVVHAGADSFGVKKGTQFLSECMDIANDHGFEPCFETHRARILYNPFTTSEILKLLPGLRLTTDLSHWLVVLDRWPLDAMNLFRDACTRSSHFHARIGHEKSPQVTEPADPRWKKHVQLFHNWWQISVNTANYEKSKLTATPEFGPFPYMHCEPFSEQPSADIVKVNRWMREQLDLWFNQ
jgi:sugar phosphate isomerase/epimerase